MALTIVPFTNKNGEERFKIVGSQGKTFLDAFGYGYYSKESAFRRIIMFAQKKKINQSITQKLLKDERGKSNISVSCR
jgi:hypothetical protein